MLHLLKDAALEYLTDAINVYKKEKSSKWKQNAINVCKKAGSESIIRLESTWKLNHHRKKEYEDDNDSDDISDGHKQLWIAVVLMLCMMYDKLCA